MVLSEKRYQVEDHIDDHMVLEVVHDVIIKALNQISHGLLLHDLSRRALRAFIIILLLASSHGYGICGIALDVWEQEIVKEDQ